MQQPLGILVYGFKPEEAEQIVIAFEDRFGAEVVLVSATGKEKSTVQEILDSGPGGEFDEKEDRMLMFLGFNDQQIKQALKAYPSDVGIPRPIFCGLTEENIKWTIEHLIEHLKEEQEQARENKI